MPTYGYLCPSCGHDYEKLQKMSDETPVDCPKCGTPGERQISGGAGIVFKGSGFYETDYKRAGEKKPAGEKADGSTSKESSKSEKGSRAESSGSGGKDTKPDKADS